MAYREGDCAMVAVVLLGRHRGGEGSPLPLRSPSRRRGDGGRQRDGGGGSLRRLGHCLAFTGTGAVGVTSVMGEGETPPPRSLSRGTKAAARPSRRGMKTGGVRRTSPKIPPC
jgi:hypothetical protein